MALLEEKKEGSYKSLNDGGFDEERELGILTFYSARCPKSSPSHGP